jgi:Histone methylation protein DOT1
MERFQDVYKESDDFHDDQEDMFPAYIDGVDTTCAPYCPSSAHRIIRALSMVNVQPCDHIMDMGSGDGRVCAAAVGEFNAARAIGIETEDYLIEKSWELARRIIPQDKLDRLEFIQGDFLAPSLTSTIKDPRLTVIFLYLLPEFNHLYKDFLIEHYERGTRIVSFTFDLKDIQELQLQQRDELEGIFIYQKLKQ